MKKVLIIYRFLPQYRVDFYNLLKQELHKYDIELSLIYGKSRNKDALKKDEVDIDWAKYVPYKSIRLMKSELLWQPYLKYFKGMNLIIVEQANKLLLNYYLMFCRYFSDFKFAYWGHGRNMQDLPNSTKNNFKYLFIDKCDWWFAYTNGVKNMLQSHNMPADKITVVQNAIDTTTLHKTYENLSCSDVESLKAELGITSDKVGIYCGGMYPEKRLDFVLEAIKIIRNAIPDFHMIFIGSGIEAKKVKESANQHDWIHYEGTKFGNEKVKYFKLSSLQIMPGLVGLVILDSFALETPIITTEYPFHSPEIEYLENHKNGIITKDDINDYTSVVISLLQSGKHRQLIKGCRSSADKYTVEKMVTNFKDGIVKCLNN